MAKIILPKGNSITGTKKKDTINWVNFYTYYQNLTVKAGKGNDLINFKMSSYKNKLYGEAGKDTIYGGKNKDSIYGGDGNDKLYGYNQNDLIKAGKGNDYLDGGKGNDKLYGEYGKNTIKGGAGNDTIYGGKGDDIIYTGKGTNTIIVNKGYGNDTIYHQGSKTTVQIKGALAGDSQKFTKIGNDLVMTYTHAGTKTSEVLTFKNYYTLKNKNIFIKGSTTKTLAQLLDAKGMTISGSGNVPGTNTDDEIVGSATNDTINAGAGNDNIEGGAGNDNITGGAGNDIISGGSGTNNIYFSTGDGNDTVQSGTGTDTLVFSEGTVVSGQLTYDENGVATIRINYGNSDSITLDNYQFNNDSRKYYQIGNTKKTIASLVGIGESVVLDSSYSEYYGTKDSDRVIDNLTKKMTISTGGGNDYIEAYYDTIKAGDGDDIVKAEKSSIYGEAGNDNITNIGTENSSNDVVTEISGGDDNDTIINQLYSYANNIKGDNGNDSIVSYGTVVNNIYGGNGDDVIRNESVASAKNIYGDGGNDYILNYGTITNIIYGGYGNDFISNESTAHSIYGDNGNDTIINTGHSYKIIGSNGDDSITNFGTITGDISGDDGNDSITNFGTITGDISGDDGNDIIINNGSVNSITGGIRDDSISNESMASAKNIYGDAGNDTITNYGIVTEVIYGGTDNDSITNFGTITGDISGDDGDDTIINKGNVTNIISGANDDSITNNGTISGYIDGGEGNDIITNNGIISGYITTGAGNDTITTSIDSSTNYILFNNGDGHDTLFLNAESNNLRFGTGITKFDFVYQENDLVIQYINNINSITIKDYANNKDNVTIQYSDGTVYNFRVFEESNFEDLEFNHDGTNLIVTDKTNVQKTLVLKNFNLSSPTTNIDLIMCSDGFHSIKTEAKIINSNNTGTSYNDVIYLLNTTRTSISGNGGNDDISIDSNSMVDYVYGDYSSTDNISIGGDDNILINGEVAYSVYGWGGDDTITVGPTGQMLNTSSSYGIYGGNGNDIINIESGGIAQYIYGESGNDTINVESGGFAQYVYGSGDDDTIIIKGSVNTIFTAFGNDIITIHSSATVDVIRLSSLAQAGSTLNFADTNLSDLTFSFNNNNLILGYSENKSVTISNYVSYASEISKIAAIGGEANLIIGSSDDENLYGTDENEVIYGYSGNDTINGHGGNDIICGGDGDDIIYAEIGSNTLTGNRGADTFVVSNNSNIITDASAEDKIKIIGTTDIAEISFERGEGDSTSLILTYGENGKLEIQNYFVLNNYNEYIMNTKAVKEFILADEYTQNEYTLEWKIANGETTNHMSNGMLINKGEYLSEMFLVQNGSANDDTITAVSGIKNWIDSKNGNDVISGVNYGDILITTGSGDNIINASVGAEVYGGYGNDTVNAGGNNFISTSGGNDVINLASTGSNTIRLFIDADTPENVIITGSTSTDVLSFVLNPYISSWNRTGLRFNNLIFEKSNNDLTIKTPLNIDLNMGQIVIQDYYNSESKLDKVFALNDEGYFAEYSIINDTTVNEVNNALNVNNYTSSTNNNLTEICALQENVAGWTSNTNDIIAEPQTSGDYANTPQELIAAYTTYVNDLLI